MYSIRKSFHIPRQAYRREGGGEGGREGGRAGKGGNEAGRANALCRRGSSKGLAEIWKRYGSTKVPSSCSPVPFTHPSLPPSLPLLLTWGKELNKGNHIKIVV